MLIAFSGSLHIIASTRHLHHRQLVFFDLDRRVDEFFESQLEREVFGRDELCGGSGAWNGVLDELHDAAGIGAHDEDAVGEVGGFFEVVGDEEDGDVYLAPDLQKVALHLRAGLGIERAEGLVHDEDARFVGEGTSDGDALLHAAGEFMRIRILELREADHLQPLTRFGFGGELAFAAHLQAEHDVALYGEPWEEGVTLEDHAAIGTGFTDVSAIEQSDTAAAFVKSGDDADEGRFAAARRADDGDELAAMDVERDPVEHSACGAVLTEGFLQVLHAQDDGALLDALEACGDVGGLLPIVETMRGERGHSEGECIAPSGLAKWTCLPRAEMDRPVGAKEKIEALMLKRARQ